MGERIRVILDCDDNTLAFERNYEFLGVAFRGKLKVNDYLSNVGAVRVTGQEAVPQCVCRVRQHGGLHGLPWTPS